MKRSLPAAKDECHFLNLPSELVVLITEYLTLADIQPLLLALNFLVVKVREPDWFRCVSPSRLGSLADALEAELAHRFPDELRDAQRHLCSIARYALDGMKARLDEKWPLLERLHEEKHCVLTGVMRRRVFCHACRNRPPKSSPVRLVAFFDERKSREELCVQCDLGKCMDWEEMVTLCGLLPGETTKFRRDNRIRYVSGHYPMQIYRYDIWRYLAARRSAVIEQ